MALNFSISGTATGMIPAPQGSSTVNGSGTEVETVVFETLNLHLYILDRQGGIVVRARASHAEGLQFEPDSIP